MSEDGGHAGQAPLVDVHAHFLTEDYVDEARAAGHDHPDGMPGWPSWSVDEHRRLMDRWGVARSILSISSPGIHFGDDAAARTLARTLNEFGAGVARADPERFGHFASLPLPDVDGALIELTLALDELGSDGVAVKTNTGGVYLGDARYEPVYQELNRRQAVVFVHPTSPPDADRVALRRPRPMLEFLFDTTRAVTDLVFTGALTRYPDIRWVFSHGGGALPLVADRLEMFRTMLFGGSASEDTVVDQLGRLWFDLAGTPFPHQVPAVVNAFGPDRLLYGSDYCWTPAAAVDQQLAAIDTAPQPADGSWRALVARNAQRVLTR